MKVYRDPLLAVGPNLSSSAAESAELRDIVSTAIGSLAAWQPPLLLGAPLQGVFKDRIWSILDAFDFRPFPQTEGREKQSWTLWMPSNRQQISMVAKGVRWPHQSTLWSTILVGQVWMQLLGSLCHSECEPCSRCHWFGLSPIPTDFHGCKFLSPIATVRNSLLKSSAHRKLVPSGAHRVRGVLFPFCQSCSFFFTLFGDLLAPV